MPKEYRLSYIGRKLVKVNPSLAIHKAYYVHVVEIVSDYTEASTQLDQIMKLDDWNEKTFGQRAYSFDPTDDGEWFKFKSKDHAEQFYQTHK